MRASFLGTASPKKETGTGKGKNKKKTETYQFGTDLVDSTTDQKQRCKATNDC